MNTLQGKMTSPLNDPAERSTVTVSSARSATHTSMRPRPAWDRSSGRNHCPVPESHYPVFDKSSRRIWATRTGNTARIWEISYICSQCGCRQTAREAGLGKASEGGHPARAGRAVRCRFVDRLLVTRMEAALSRIWAVTASESIDR